MTAFEKVLFQTEKQRHVCVGLDTDPNLIPYKIRTGDDPVFNFNKKIIDATIAEAAAYKLNFAFYEKLGITGMSALQRTVEYIRKVDDKIILIGDAKRGDIGNTSKMYADAIFGEYGFDCSTLSPYMGKDSLDPFFEFSDKLNFILVLTSNKGSEDFEKLLLESGKPLYKEILSRIKQWYPSTSLGTVFGATNIENLKADMAELQGTTVLVPGVGAQGGSAHEVAKLFYASGHKRFLINSSRNIIFASDRDDFPDRAAEELAKLNNGIRQAIRSI
jgi:orotidine-5'-phosphate decarboxylase